MRTNNLDKANEVVSNDINARKESISGVSMDEEAINFLSGKQTLRRLRRL